jgi:hypothetical protein
MAAANPLEFINKDMGKSVGRKTAIGRIHFEMNLLLLEVSSL